jgi:hypothetical protein
MTVEADGFFHHRGVLLGDSTRADLMLVSAINAFASSFGG